MLYMYYKQIDCVAIGSPLGLTFANLFLVYYAKMWLDKCLLQFNPKYYFWNVDDLFLMFEKKDHNNFFLKYIKSRHRNIKFVFEEEGNNKIAFLNISITGNELKMSYKYLYFKSTKLVVYT